MNKKLKVIQVGDSFFPHMDGVTRVIHNYGLELARHMTSIVVFPHQKKYDYHAPYETFGVSSFRFKAMDMAVARPFLAWIQLRSFLRQTNPDLIHLHSPFMLGQISLSYAKQHHIKVVSTLHSQYHQDFEKFIRFSWVRHLLMSHLSRFYNSCDEVWTVNQSMTDILRSYGYKGLIRVMPNASDFEEVMTLTSVQENQFRQEYELPLQRDILLFVGQISLKKNLNLILESMKSYPTPDKKPIVVMIGTGEDLPLLKKKVKEMDLENDVFFIGKITDRTQLSMFYSVSKLFVFPSTYDASSIAVMEAATHGVPSLLIKGATTAEHIIDQENGFLSEESVSAYSQAIRDALHHPRYQQISENALNTVTKSWRNIGQEVALYYQQLVKKQ